MPHWAWGRHDPASPPPPSVEEIPPDGTQRHQLPGSRFSFTYAEASNTNKYRPVDWWPEDHPQPVPEIVRHGRESAEIYPCGLCHRMTGNGRPENAAITGLDYAYFVQQLMDFRNGLRRSSDANKSNALKMIHFASSLTDDEIRDAATYFTSIDAKPWIKVIETDSVPKMTSRNDMFYPIKGPNAGVEPLGRRIIETPASEQAELWRDSRIGFLAYVPRGSVKQGEALVIDGVTTSGGKVTPCTVCHGVDLGGLGAVPRLAGRSASYLTRQLYDMQQGNRAGPWSTMMAPVLIELGPDDLLVAAAYLASLDP